MTYLTQVGGALSLLGALGYFSSNYIFQSSKNSANRGILWIGKNAKTISLLMAAIEVVILVVNYVKRFFLDVEGQLKELFKSKIPIKKLLVIDKIEIGIIFNPNGPSLTGNPLVIANHVALIAEQVIPDKVLTKIEANLPEECTFSYTVARTFNGRPTLKHFNFKQ